MKNFIKRQREIRLRKWCMEIAVRATPHGGAPIKEAERIYDWVTSEERRLQLPSGEQYRK